MTKGNDRSSGGGRSKRGRGGSRMQSGRGPNTGSHDRNSDRSQRSRSERNRSKEAQDTEPHVAKHKRVKRPKPTKLARGTAERPYAVGRGKPPVEHQWKPGQSGNSRGRPKGQKNEATILKELFDQKFPIPIRGKIRHLTFRETMYRRFSRDVLQGPVSTAIKCAAFLLNRAQLAASGGTQDTPLSEDDRAILQDYLRNISDSDQEKDQ